jgi:hypothetical protein
MRGVKFDGSATTSTRAKSPGAPSIEAAPADIHASSRPSGEEAGAGG